MQPLTAEGKVKFVQLVSEADFSFVDSTTLSVQDKFSNFLKILSTALGNSFPIVHKTIHHNNFKWFSHDLRNDRDTLKLLSDLSHSFPENELLHASYKKFLYNYRSKLAKAKSHSISEYAHKSTVVTNRV